MTPKKGKSFLIGTLYRNPAERAEWTDRFESFIEHVSSENKEIIIMGILIKIYPLQILIGNGLILLHPLGLDC